VRLSATARRQQVLAAALPVFARLGCAGASTRQLAAAAGITEPVLYRHFAGKDDLFAAVLREVAGRLAEAITEAITRGRDVRARLETLAAALPDLLVRFEDELRVLCGAAASHGDATQAKAARQALQRLGKVLTVAFAGQGGGLRRGLDPEVAAFFLLELGLGSALLRPVRVPAVLRPGFGERVVELMTRALLPPASMPPRRRRLGGPRSGKRS
jgi:AcrR family transcriptional regulator